MYSFQTVANWRRERDSPNVHLLPEAAQETACGLDRQLLGATIWDTNPIGAQLCSGCSQKILEATDKAIRLTDIIESDKQLEMAKDSLRHLVRLIPEGVTRDLVVYARVCVVRGDKKGAHESVVRWRENMQATGVFGRDD